MVFKTASCSSWWIDTARVHFDAALASFSHPYCAARAYIFKGWSAKSGNAVNLRKVSTAPSISYLYAALRILRNFSEDVKFPYFKPLIILNSGPSTSLVSSKAMESDCCAATFGLTALGNVNMSRKNPDVVRKTTACIRYCVLSEDRRIICASWSANAGSKVSVLDVGGSVAVGAECAILTTEYERGDTCGDDGGGNKKVVLVWGFSFDAYYEVPFISVRHIVTTRG